MNGRIMPTDGAGNREVLGDLTNSYGKRGLHLAPGKFVIGNEVGVAEGHVEKRLFNSGPRKRICRGPENLFKGEEPVHSISSNSINKEPKSWKTWMLSENNDAPNIPSLESHLLPHSSCFQNHHDNSQENERTSSMKLPKKAITLRGALNPGLHYIRGKTFNQEPTAVRQVGNDCVSAISGPMEDGKTQTAPVLEEGIQEASPATSIDEADGTSYAYHSLESSKLEFMKLNKGITQHSDISTASLLDICNKQRTRDSRSTSVDKRFDSINIANMPGSTRCHDPISGAIRGNKSCCCNFCLKASYMWADLLSQDVRGRLAELGKSLRLANTLAGKDYFRDFTGGCSERSLKNSRMDIDLAQRWRSLFNHTENALHSEGAQMHANLLKLKELTANCKRDLENISLAPPNLPDASDGSD